MKSATRLMHKNFKDQQKQESIELFLGFFTVAPLEKDQKKGQKLFRVKKGTSSKKMAVLCLDIQERRFFPFLLYFLFFFFFFKIILFLFIPRSPKKKQIIRNNKKNLFF